MSTADIPLANRLREFAGWNQTERDWRDYLELEPEGCFVAEIDGQLAGTATTIRYGDAVGWIGMVLVHPNLRRRGIGSRLLNYAIRYLQDHGVRCVKLDATPLGKKVYEPLGFVDEYELSRFEAATPAVPAGDAAAVTAWTVADTVALPRFDALVFGANRSRVLAAMSARAPELCFVARDDRGEIRGYLMARHGARAVQIGPWIARDPGTAEQLLLACFRRIQGAIVFIDVPARNSAGVELVTRHGFRVQRTLTRMFLGENTAPGEPHLVYGISSPEKG